MPLLNVLSDLHLELEPFSPGQTDADVVVLAGDVHTGTRGIDWAKETYTGKPVVYVLGNHEYYGKAIPKHTDTLRDRAKGSNVHVLENESITVGDTVFLGCTLWTDFRLHGNSSIAGYDARQWMRDYRKIRVSPSFSQLRPDDTASFCARSLRWLREELGRAEGKRVAVVTHHAPSGRSIPGGQEDNRLDPAYASNLDDVIAASGASLWIHGHLHTRADYMIGETRVVCNARGYPDETGHGFEPGLTVEVSDL